MVVILKSAGLFLQNYRSWSGLTGIGLFDLGLGTICVVDRGSGGWRCLHAGKQRRAQIWIVQIRSKGARRPREGAAVGEAVDRRCGPDPRVHGAPVTQRRRVTRSGPSVSRSAAEDARARETAAHGRLAAAPGGGFAGSSSEELGLEQSDHVFNHGKALHGAGNTGNSTTCSRRRLWLRVNGATASGGRRRRPHGRRARAHGEKENRRTGGIPTLL
jgi:hypothetical protein